MFSIVFIDYVIVLAVAFTINTFTLFAFYRYSTCCWITLADGRDPRWEVRVKGNLTQRAGNGLINTSPVSTMPLIVRVQQGCNHTIEIPG